MIVFPGPVEALVTLPVSPDGAGIERVLKLERAVRSALPEVAETVPAFNRLLIIGDARSWDPERLREEVTRLVPGAMSAEMTGHTSAPLVDLPACYDPDLAPDLLELAAAADLDPDAVAQIHSGQEYRVLATGFAPGFAYLGDLDPRISMPRRASPRPRVETGSIGIADRRTGVYPSAGPGGWQIVGRVPPTLFADAADRIARFEPGARVAFRPIDLASYEAEA